MRKVKDFFYNIKSDKDPIFKAVQSKNYPLLQELVNNTYCDINQFDASHKTLLDYATFNADIEIMSFLVLRKARIGLLFYLVRSEDKFIKHIENLHAAGYNLNNYDCLGYTPMHYASSLNFNKAVEKLISLKAKVSSTSFCGKTPLNLAVKNNKVGVFAGKA